MAVPHGGDYFGSTMQQVKERAIKTHQLERGCWSQGASKPPLCFDIYTIKLGTMDDWLGDGRG